MGSVINPLDKEVLQKLLSKWACGSNHYRIETIMHCGWKAHERGPVKKSIKKLIRVGLIRYYNQAKEAIQLTNEGVVVAKDLIESG